MSILYFPNRVYRAKVPAIDRIMSKRQPLTSAGSQNVFSTALSAIITSNDNWQVDSVAFNFSNTASRNFNAYVMNGVNVVANLNDYLWFQLNTTPPSKITLSPGFYTGAQLATQLQTQLDADAYFSGAGVTFTVTYASATGLFTIAPSSGTIRYINVNIYQWHDVKDSIAGHLFGLTTDSAYGATVVSDTAVYGLNNETAFITQTANSDTSYLHDDTHTLTLDQAIHLTSNTGANVTIDYVVTYEGIVEGM